MSTSRSEERALEVMRKELAAEPVPELPWNKMERELLARLDEPPMTSHPRSLDARIDDVPVPSVRHLPQRRFARAGAFVLALAAAWTLFWISPLRRGESIVVSTASPGGSVSPPALATPTEGPSRELTVGSVEAALSKCRSGDKPSKGKLTISLEADGQIDTVRSEPPLEPAVMQCLLAALRAGKFPPNDGPITITF